MKKTNPVWSSLGYELPEGHAAAPALLRVTTIRRDTDLDFDVLVVGSGAGGGAVADEMAAAGKHVGVLESGGGMQSPDFSPNEEAGRRLFQDQGMTATRDLGVGILSGATLGGGTTVNWSTSLVLPAHIREEWARLSGCRFFTGESFEQAFDAVKKRLSVGLDESVVNRNNAKLRDGCEALGYRWCVLPRNARGCDPAFCGYCTFGCSRNAKQSSAVTFLREAQKRGATVITNCRAERVMIDGGRVTGVEAVATDPETGARHAVRVRAPVVVVAAGALNTPVLLMRSGLTLRALGRNLFLHPTAVVAGTYEGEEILPWVGPPQTIMSDEFAELSGDYGFRLETAPAHPGLMASALPWFDAQDHRSRMQRLARTGLFIALVRDRAPGRVRAGRGGRPVIEYSPGKLERGLLRRGVQEAARVHWAAGAREILSPHTRKHCFRRTSESRAAVEEFCSQLAREPVDHNWMAVYSAHQMGTARMGSSARDAVCDAEGEVFGVKNLFVADASAFPASSGVNPMLTIMALSKHTAQCIRAR